jgi:hypothetical protein
MAKTSRNPIDRQNATIAQFESVIRKESYREEPTFLESLIEKSKSKTKLWQERLARESKPEFRYTHNRPTHYKTQTL